MTTAGEETHIIHQRDENRYDIFLGSARGAYAEYELADGVMTMTHTVTDPQQRGQGLAGLVVGRALDDAKAAGLTVVPQCWYVAQFIERHPEYATLLRSAT
ncbi:MAG: GNAT family N-acetyltransferase [Ilumatobacteraceae bacterium]